MKKTHLFIVLSVVGCVAMGSAWGMQGKSHDVFFANLKENFVTAKNNMKQLSNDFSNSESNREETKKFLQKYNLERQKRDFALHQIKILKNHDNLYKAIQKDDSKEIVSLIENNPDLDINAQSMVDDLNGSTPLHYAALLGHENSLQTLLDNKADMSVKDKFGRTPSDYATRAGKENIVSLFSEHLLNQQQLT